MTITLQQLQQIMPAAGPRAESFLGPLNEAMAEFTIDTPKRMAAFLAQVAHESGQLAHLTENLNYSAARLRQVWPARFPTDEIAAQYGRNPEKLANKVYASRMGNGDETSGDGFRYCGRGLFQLTGKDNYQRCGDALGVDLLQHPMLVAGPTTAARSAAWFWWSNGLNALADAENFDAVSDKINLGRVTAAQGDAIGYKDRLEIYHRALQVLS